MCLPKHRWTCPTCQLDNSMDRQKAMKRLLTAWPNKVLITQSRPWSSTERKMSSFGNSWPRCRALTVLGPTSASSWTSFFLARALWFALVLATLAHGARLSSRSEFARCSPLCTLWAGSSQSTGAGSSYSKASKIRLKCNSSWTKRTSAATSSFQRDRRIAQVEAR